VHSAIEKRIKTRYRQEEEKGRKEVRDRKRSKGQRLRNKEIEC
jgi:hypothetical protein